MKNIIIGLLILCLSINPTNADNTDKKTNITRCHNYGKTITNETISCSLFVFSAMSIGISGISLAYPDIIPLSTTGNAISVAASSLGVLVSVKDMLNKTWRFIQWNEKKLAQTCGLLDRKTKKLKNLTFKPQAADIENQRPPFRLKHGRPRSKSLELPKTSSLSEI